MVNSSGSLASSTTSSTISFGTRATTTPSPNLPTSKSSPIHGTERPPLHFDHEIEKPHATQVSTLAALRPLPNLEPRRANNGPSK